MNDIRPMLYYVFRDGNEFNILHITDAEADERRERGEHFEGCGQKTLADAQELLASYLAERKSTSQG